MLEHKQDPGQGAPRIPLALLVRTGQGLLAGVGAPGRAGEGGVGGRFVHRVTFCAEGNEFRLFSAQSVTLCTKCSPRRPRRSSLPGGPSPAWSHKVASCGVVRVRGLVVGVESEVSYQGRSPCRGACRLCRPVGVGAQGVCFRVELACRSCGGGGGRRWEVVVPAGGAGSCCTFIPGSWWGQWRGSNVFSPWGASGDRMNVQLGRRCTFILFPGPGLPGRSAWPRRLLIAVCKKNVQLRLTAARERRLSCHDLPVGAI